MANLVRRQGREREPAQMSRIDPFRTFRDLLRWDPFGEWDVMPRAAEAMFNPDIDIKENANGLMICADLPGLREEDIDISITGNRLVLSGRREEESRKEDEQYYSYERQYGTFSRTFTLPEMCDPDQVKAELKDGVLTVTIPRRAGSQSRHVPLIAHGSGDGNKPQIQGASSSGSQSSAGSQGGGGRSQSGGEGTSGRSGSGARSEGGEAGKSKPS